MTHATHASASVRCGLVIAVLAIAWSGSASIAPAALPPGEQLVPANSKFFATCRNARELDEALNKTLLGQLLDDPAMKPFRDDLKVQLEAQSSKGNIGLGIQLADIRGVCDGQVSMAVVPLTVAAGAPAKTGTIALLDVTGHAAQVTALQQKIAATLAQHKATAQPFTTPSGAKGTHYTIPPKDPGAPTRELVEVVQTVGGDLVWLLGDETSLPTLVSATLAGQKSPLLAEDPNFIKVIAETAPPAGEPAAHVAFYVEPLGLVEALRFYEWPPAKHKPDALAVFRGAGFDAVKGLGGQATADVGDYGMLLRVGIQAPQPWVKSMNMLSFVPGADFAPPAFVADDIHAYASVYLDVVKAFDHFGPIFDGFLEDEGIWADVIKSLEEDPDGPQIKLRKEFFEKLSQRVTGIVDHDPKNPGGASRYLLAFETPDPVGVANVVKRAFANDPNVKPIKIGDLDAYEIVATEEVPPNAPNQQGVVGGQRVLVSALVTVSGNYLFIASNIEILQKVIGPAPTAPLANAPDFVAVNAELKKFLPPAQPQLVGLGFSRLDQLLEADYEQFRLGKMPGGETLLGQLLDLIMRDDEKSGPREKKLDGSKLPPFAQIRKYLSPGGLTLRNTADGFAILALTHEKAAPAAAPAGK